MNASNTAISPLTRGEPFTLSALADSYMACYQGRDPSFGHKLSFSSCQQKYNGYI